MLREVRIHTGSNSGWVGGLLVAGSAPAPPPFTHDYCPQWSSCPDAFNTVPPLPPPSPASLSCPPLLPPQICNTWVWCSLPSGCAGTDLSGWRQCWLKNGPSTPTPKLSDPAPTGWISGYRHAYL